MSTIILISVKKKKIKRLKNITVDKKQFYQFAGSKIFFYCSSEKKSFKRQRRQEDSKKLGEGNFIKNSLLFARKKKVLHKNKKKGETFQRLELVFLNIV